jgi:hypothetical protein
MVMKSRLDRKQKSSIFPHPPSMILSPHSNDPADAKWIPNPIAT